MIRKTFLLFVLLVSPLSAQEKSVNPGINKSFKSPNVKDYIGRFEREGRDVFEHRDEIVKACGVKPGMIIADIGTGTGLFTRLFSREVEASGKVYAVDISAEFVKHVERSAQADGMKNVVGVVCGQDATNLAPGTVDLAFICDTYHHFEFPHKTMSSVHRALKRDGIVVLIDFHRKEGVSRKWIMGHVRAGQEVFAKEILDAGFRQVDEKKGLLDESYFLRFQKIERKTGE